MYKTSRPSPDSGGRQGEFDPGARPGRVSAAGPTATPPSTPSLRTPETTTAAETTAPETDEPTDGESPTQAGTETDTPADTDGSGAGFTAVLAVLALLGAALLAARRHQANSPSPVCSVSSSSMIAGESLLGSLTAVGIG